VFSLLFDSDAEPASIPYILAKLGAILLIAAFYLLIHEKIHAMAMERLSAAKASLGFQGTTAYASSRAYFSKRDHRIVLLAPAFFLTLLITLLTLILPVDWFWVGLSALILNLAGSVTVLLCSLASRQRTPQCPGFGFRIEPNLFCTG